MREQPNQDASMYESIFESLLMLVVLFAALTLDRIEGSAEITADNDFIALVLMATALSLRTLRI